MAKSRSIAAGLIHGLDRLDQPVYLLDCERRIVFANAACVDWLGLPLDSIVGQSCDYHSLADGTSQSVACGLSPPPDVFRGQRLVAPIHQTTDENPARRLAEFIPLLKENELELVLAIVAATDLPADDVEQLLVDSPIASFSPQEYQCLHEQMAQFRARAAQEPRFDRLLGNTPAIQLARSQVQLAIVG
ncbi:MAG: PAS domain-containing protein, partial [Planctomycetota bacterium]|nr:PAS domain-containing protein [Planctomycetota bacterium]